MKKFDLEAAKNGAPVVDREGNDVRILCFDRQAYYHIVALVKTDDCEQVITCRSNTEELFMKTIKEYGWLNIYKYNQTRKLSLHHTKDDADDLENTSRIACIKIEWDE